MYKIIDLFPKKGKSKDWKWKNVFVTTVYPIGDDISQELVNEILNKCFEEIKKFELYLQENLS